MTDQTKKIMKKIFLFLLLSTFVISQEIDSVEIVGGTDGVDAAATGIRYTKIPADSVTISGTAIAIGFEREESTAMDQTYGLFADVAGVPSGLPLDTTIATAGTVGWIVIDLVNLNASINKNTAYWVALRTQATRRWYIDNTSFANHTYAQAGVGFTDKPWPAVGGLGAGQSRMSNVRLIVALDQVNGYKKYKTYKGYKK